MAEETYQAKTPVLLILFNRAGSTRQAFEAIRRVRPPRLLIAADGPRPQRPDDREKCAAARRVVEAVDWPCEVTRDYSDVNLGCRRRPQTAITWAFGLSERVVVLEDDCLPNASFFRFCDDMLERFADDERVMTVGGTNMLGSWKADRQSYHFSLLCGTPGWASWRRAWRHYDPDMRAWALPEVRELVHREIFSRAFSKSRQADYEFTFQGKLDAWDYQWELARTLQSGLAVLPAVNLVQNTGFDAEATHSRDPDHPWARLPLLPLQWPLRPPFGVYRDLDFEKQSLAVLQSRTNWLNYVPDPVIDTLRPFVRAARRVLRRRAA